MPCNSGTPLDRLEGNEATLEAIDALVNLSHDSLDIIAWSLTEQLERLAKVRQSKLSGAHPHLILTIADRLEWAFLN